MSPAYEQALSRGAPPRILGEVAAMAHLFGGFPRAIEGLRELSAFLRRAGREHELARLDDDPSTRPEHGARGRTLFEQVYSAESGKVRDLLDSALPGYSRWVIEHAYGRVLSRPGLSARHRELLAVSALCALDCRNQLFSHARGARRLGAPLGDLEAMLDGIRDRLGEDPVEALRSVIRQAHGGRSDPESPP